MAFLQWRRFLFFDKEIVKVPGTDDQFDLLKDIDITCCSSGFGHIVIGDVEGYIHCINRQLNLSTFKAYELRSTHIYQCKQNPILISVGEDEPGVNPLIKVWNLEKLDKNGSPMCTRIIRAIPGNTPTCVTVLAVQDNLNNMAVGFENGSVIVYKGDVSRERHSKQKILQPGQASISGLAFRNVGRSHTLFVVSTDCIMSYNLAVKDWESKIVLDERGCTSRCATMTDAKEDNQLVIARKDALYFYQPDDRGQCLAFEGEKIILHWFRGYLVVVSKESKSMSAVHVGAGNTMQMNIVTVYDIQNKFIAYSAPMPEVTDIVSEWGSLYIIASDKKLYNLQEKDTQSKLEVFFRKNLYNLAINVAKSRQYDEEGLIDIFRQYADHLYLKGDHDAAINQYIKTIGKLEPSYVIRKFLDAQRIHNLTAYLQALHKKNLANEDHTTLLLNCYTKLKDNSKLDEFIMTKDREIDFDVEIAIKVCRQAGFYTHALYLAERHQRHEWYLKIQLEDHRDYINALDYISKLTFHKAEDNMKKYGKMLMEHEPEKTKELLKRLCTDYKPSNEPLVDVNMLDGTQPDGPFRAQAEDFIHIFVNNSDKLIDFLEHMLKMQADCHGSTQITLLELYLLNYKSLGDQQERNMQEKKIMNLLRATQAQHDIDQALVLCKINVFKPGILLLYEKAKLYQQIIHFHMQHKDYAEAILTCEKFGDQQPNLWVEVLTKFAESDDDAKQYIIQVLHQIERRKLLSPLMVIETLASSMTTTLSCVKEYLIRHLNKENEEIVEDERLIKQYREESERIRQQNEEIQHSAKIFQITKCSACNNFLELPCVHFMCQHSYHHQCFESYSAESDAECPLCLHENRKVLDILRAREQVRDLHEQFHHQLERAEDSFSVVADYFGRGVFNKVTLITDSTTRQGSTTSSSYNPFESTNKY